MFKKYEIDMFEGGVTIKVMDSPMASGDHATFIGESSSGFVLHDNKVYCGAYDKPIAVVGNYDSFMFGALPKSFLKQFSSPNLAVIACDVGIKVVDLDSLTVDIDIRRIYAHPESSFVERGDNQKLASRIKRGINVYRNGDLIFKPNSDPSTILTNKPEDDVIAVMDTNTTHGRVMLKLSDLKTW